MNRKGNQKKGGKKRRLFLWCILLVLLSLAPISYLNWSYITVLAASMHDSLFNRSYFSVREILVRGVKKVGGDEIVVMAGLSQGMNIWDIDPEMIEKKVRKHPWVKRVLVRRELPGRVIIEVEERVVKGIVMLEKLYYVDSEGFVFKEVEKGRKIDWPLLTGLRQVDLASQAGSTRQRIREALRLSELVARSFLAVSEIHFRKQGGLVLYPIDYRIPIRMGWGDWRGKVERLERVLAVWKGKENHLDALNLAFRDRVVVNVRRNKG